MQLAPSSPEEVTSLFARMWLALARFFQSGFVSSAGWSILFSLTTIAVGWLWLRNPESRDLLTWTAVAVAIIGVFPVSYLVYIGFGGDNARRQRLRDDFRLLGLASKDELEQSFDKLYQKVYGKGQFLAYIGLIMLVSLLMLSAFRYSGDVPATGKIIQPETVVLMFYSFLGAYIFSVQAIIRRYNTADLQPQVYSSALVRMLFALTLTFVGSSLLQIAGTQLSLENSSSAGSLASAAVLAFLIGVFPDSGLRWFMQQSARVLSTPTDRSSERPLRDIIGISTWHEARLSEMGIDDAQNLATADIGKLLMATQFDVQQIISWIDQAILYTRVGDKIDRFRDAKISTFYEFRQLYSSLMPALITPITAEELVVKEQEKQRLTALLGLSGVDELHRLADDANFPNYAYIAEYYSRMATVVRQRADRGMNVLLGAQVETDFRRAVDELERRAAHNASDARLFNNLGFAYYNLNIRQKACQAYTQAIELDPQFAEAYYNRSVIYLEMGHYQEAIRDNTRALSINPMLANAYNNRGLTYLKMGYLDQALKDLHEALRLNDRLPNGYFNRGFVYSEQGDVQEAIQDFERAYLLGYREDALMWFRWGEALLRAGDRPQAVTKLTRALLLDNNLTLAFARRGYAYLEQGEAFYPQATNDFNQVIDRATSEEGRRWVVADGSLLAAYTNWGQLEARRKNFATAVEKYQAALQLDESYVAARSNLAVAYFQLHRLEEARNEFQRILEIAAYDSHEAQRAATWLARINEMEATASSGANGGRAGNGVSQAVVTVDGLVAAVLEPGEAPMEGTA
jgi:tetratricopeptide (TPR) repeat protein